MATKAPIDKVRGRVTVRLVGKVAMTATSIRAEGGELEMIFNTELGIMETAECREKAMRLSVQRKASYTEEFDRHFFEQAFREKVKKVLMKHFVLKVEMEGPRP